MQIVLDDSKGSPGGRFTGQIIGTDCDEVRVDLLAVESTSGTIGKPVTSSRIVESTSIRLIDGARFEVGIPQSSVPQFQIKTEWMKVRAESQLAWTLEAITEDETRATAQVQLTATAGASHPERADAVADDIATFVKEKRRSALISDGAVMILFLAIGVLSVAAGIYLLATPSEADGTAAFAWSANIFGLLTLLFVAWWFVNKLRPIPVRGADIVSVSPAATRPGRIDVEMNIDAGVEIEVGHVLLHYATTSIVMRNTSQGTIRGSRREVDGWWDTIAYENWQTVSGDGRVGNGSSMVSFDVPNNVPPSYGGDRVINHHVIRVHKAGVKSSRLSPSRLERHVVVI